MGDPSGPWQEYGGGQHLDDTRPADAGYEPMAAWPATVGDGDGGGAALRLWVAEAAWRYRSAPLWARVAVDVVAGAAALALIVGLSLALRSDGGPGQAGAGEAIVVQTVPTTSTTTTATTTTSTTVPPTTAPTTTTTVPPTTATTSPPVVPPPSSPPTTERVHYDDCLDALFAGALPLEAGDPGYGRHLDLDGDGQACEFPDDLRGDGGGN